MTLSDKMTLSEYLIEAVAKRKTGKYVDFPLKPDKESVVHFLEMHGFREVKYGKDFDFAKDRVYSLGDFSSDMGSHWIRFFDPNGSGNCYFCRVNNIGNPRYVDFKIDGYGPLTFDEFRYEVDKEFC